VTDKKFLETHHIFEPTAGARCTIFHKLCTVIELIETIKKCQSFFDPTQFLLRGARKNSA